MRLPTIFILCLSIIGCSAADNGITPSDAGNNKDGTLVFRDSGGIPQDQSLPNDSRIPNDGSQNPDGTGANGDGGGGDAPGLPDAGSPDGTGGVDQGPGAAKLMKIVAVVYSHLLPDGTTECLTARDMPPDGAPYWDLRDYSYCDSEDVPRCRYGAKRMGMAMVQLPDGTVKYHTACVLPESAEGTQIVATLISQVLADGTKECRTAHDADGIAAAAGYWDLENYSYCTAGKDPRCRNDSRWMMTGMTRLKDNDGNDVVKYHHACVLPGSSDKNRIVATIRSEVKADGTTSCLSAHNGGTAAGYWDLHNYSYCDPADDHPRCRNGANRVTAGMSFMPDGAVKYHHSCVLPSSSTGSQIVATAHSRTFPDGSTACHTAHDGTGASAGYWDLGNHVYCDSGDVPRCRFPAQRLTTGISMMPDNSVKYHSACVVP